MSIDERVTSSIFAAAGITPLSVVIAFKRVYNPVWGYVPYVGCRISRSELDALTAIAGNVRVASGDNGMVNVEFPLHHAKAYSAYDCQLNEAVARNIAEQWEAEAEKRIGTRGWLFASENADYWDAAANYWLRYAEYARQTIESHA